MSILRNLGYSLCAVVFVALVASVAFAQNPTPLPPSEIPSGETVVQNWGNGGFMTNRGIYTVEHGDGPLDFPYARRAWTPPSGEIYSIHSKLTKDWKGFFVFALTTDGRVFRFDLSNQGQGQRNYDNVTEITSPDVDPVQAVRAVWGDDIYAITASGQIWVLRDSVHWLQDTAGLNGARVSEIAFDDAGNVFAATSDGLLYQTAKGAGWSTKLAGSCQGIFMSHAGLLYTSANSQGIRVSSDGGATWPLDTGGVSQATMLKMTDDTAGNLYVITYDFPTGNRLWTQKPGSPWREIGQRLTALWGPSPSYNALHDVSADSGIVYVSTNSGLFYSSDIGTTWNAVTRGLTADKVYSYYKFANGRDLATTTLGLFTKSPGETDWTKRFPSNYFLSQIPIFVDNSKRVYAIGSSRTKGYSSIANDIFISTDQGLTWSPDTTGLWQLQVGNEFVDETGAEHLAVNMTDHPGPFVKEPGGSWHGDSTGYVAAKGDFPSAFATDHHGYIYLAITNYSSGTPRLLRRPIAGGAWSEVSTAALGGLPYSFTATKDGKLVAGNSNISMGAFDGTSWTIIPNPPGLSNASGYPQSVDASGRLWVIFGSVDQNYNYTPLGVYWTPDLGQHWTKAADGSVNFASLVSFGDTTYGLNSGQGIYRMTASSSIVSGEQSTPIISMQFIPNPTTERVAIQFSNVASASVHIFDALGRAIRSMRGAGSVDWNTCDEEGQPVPAGTYCVQASGVDLSSHEFRSFGKIVVRR